MDLSFVRLLLSDRILCVCWSPTSRADLGADASWVSTFPYQPVRDLPVS